MAENNHETSARLRATEKIAQLCGFEYDLKQYPYGGFFSTFELEQIIKKLEGVKESG